MKLKDAMNRYCRGLTRSANDAVQEGLDSADVFQGLLGVIAISVRRAGGDDKEVARTFRALADCYEEENDPVIDPMARTSHNKTMDRAQCA
jgi:hypothetical protein